MSGDERGERLRFLRARELFAGLSDAALETLDAALVERVLPAGADLFRQGDAPDSLFFVREGELSVRTEEADGSLRVVGSIHAGEYVGETALLVSAPRSTTVSSEQPSLLLGLSAASFSAALAAEPSLRRVSARLLERSLPWLRAAITILFGQVSDELRLEIEGGMSWVRLARNDLLFRRGDPGDALYVVLQGRLHVLREQPQGGHEIVAEVGRGEPVGEVALLTGEPRTLSVRAARDADLVRLSKEGFDTLLTREPRTMVSLLRRVATRMSAKAAGADGAPRTSTIALVVLGARPAPEALLAALDAGLAEAGSALIVDAERFDAAHGPGASRTPPDHRRQLHLAAWHNRLEAEYDTVVYACDAQPTLWSERCLRHADRILLIAWAADEPSLGAFASLLATTSAARELVLLHASGAQRPAGSARWLEAVGAGRHHHVRLDRPQDARRVSRFLSGRAVGVVLGGGGARGFAHAGMLRALEESGVPVDFVGGVSMGAVAAAAFAMGLDHQAIRKALKRLFVDTLPWRHDLPLVSLFSPSKGERAMQEVFGEIQIEDLWTNYFCVATNITRAEPRVLRRGPAWRAVRASGSYPGLVPPVPEAGELLVDGGLMDNLPVEVMRSLCPGEVIACDVSREVELTVDPALVLCPSPLRLLLNRLLKRSSQPFPGIGPILLRSLECREVAEKERRRRAASLYLAPPVGQFGLLDVTKLDAIVETGYRYALERCRELPAGIPRDAPASPGRWESA